jgi:N-methylhydantoinase A
MVHGTTVGTNALLERRGSRTALVTTAGFRDLLTIARQDRPRIYALEPRRPPALVPEALCFEIEERTLADGSVESEPDAASLQALRKTLAATGVEAVAVVLLHSYANPGNEERVCRALDPLGIPVSASHRVLREYREYERATATVINAYLRPLMESYLSRLGAEPLWVLRSDGGTLSAAAAAEMPVQTVLSGPAGGVVGAAWLGARAGEEQVITFDMGGTSTDVSLIDGRPRLTADGSFGPWPLRLPMIDIHTVGAGGGSIAWRDRGGALRVGPRSAGSDPGPACYGAGDQPTVTDANLHLGRICPEGFLGGEMSLDPGRARVALGRLADALGLTADRAAEGILRVAEASMERAIRVISLERGHDPSRFVLYCFGGAGGLHVVALARSLGIPRVRIPAEPGVFSALGMLAADVVLHRSETVLLNVTGDAVAQLEGSFRRMEQEALGLLAAEGFGPEEVRLERTADLRYRGQSFELTVPFGDRMEEAFHGEHESRRGHADPTRCVEIVNVRLRAVGPVPPPELARQEPGSRDAAPAGLGPRRVWLEEGRWEEAPAYARERMRPGMEVQGPALVTEYSATHWLPRGVRARVDELGSLVLEVGG